MVWRSSSGRPQAELKGEKRRCRRNVLAGSIFQPSGRPGKSAVIYEYQPSRSGEVAETYLKGYKGVVQTDGYQGYDFIDGCSDLVHVGCWAHARRKFIETLEAMKGIEPKDGKPRSVDVAIDYIGQLYGVEREIKKRELKGDEIVEYRKRMAKPILKRFKKWLDEKSSQVVPKSLLGKAIEYTLNEWERLIRYIDHGYVSLDNNAAENAIRPFVVGRKNWLFSGRPEGARASSILYSLIETAKANGLEPFAYLHYLFERLPGTKTEEATKALLPQYLEKAQIDSG
jgi:transposase